MKASGNDRFPRGAILVVVLGILATVAVAWVSDEDLVSSKALPWAESQKSAIPAAEPAEFGQGGRLELSSSGIDVSAPNTAEYRLFQVGGEVIVDPGSATGEIVVSCTATAPSPTVNARTPNRPAGFPGPIENLDDAPWPGDVTVDFSAQGSPYSTVTLPTAYMGYGGQPGIEVEWGDWEAGSQNWVWTLPADRESNDARLRFVSLWRTFKEPAIEMVCEATVAGDTARVGTGGRLVG